MSGVGLSSKYFSDAGTTGKKEIALGKTADSVEQVSGLCGQQGF